MQDLKITIIQADLHWEDTTANLAMFEEKIWQIGDYNAKYVVLHLHE